MAPHWVLIVLLCLATHRATRMVTRDAFPLFRVPREWVDQHWGVDDETVELLHRAKAQDLAAAKEAGTKPKLTKLAIPGPFKRSFAYLVTCDWCTSIWVSAALTAGCMIFIGFSWPWFILLWLTASSVTGLIAQREPE